MTTAIRRDDAMCMADKPASRSLGCPAEAAVMVGDDVESDIAGAMAADLAGLLVRTGKYRSGDEARITPPPSAVLADLSEAVDWILERARRAG